MFKSPPPNAYELHFPSDGTSEWEKTGTPTGDFDDKLFENAKMFCLLIFKKNVLWVCSSFLDALGISKIYPNHTVYLQP